MSFLYREAGRVMQGVEDGKASLKTLTLGRPNSVGGGKGGDENGPKRKLYAMVSETLRYKPLLDELLVKAGLMSKLFSAEHVRDKAQAYVMLYEMLLGKGSIHGGGKLKRHVTQFKPQLEKFLGEAKAAKGLPVDGPNDALLPKSARRQAFPRYARVNLATCAQGVDGVASTLREEGFEVEIDDVVPSLLKLPAGTDLHGHPMVKDGRLVLQDKSSCFSAEALLGSEAETAARQAGREWKGGDVIDACAAPGNKAMHAASLLSRMGSSSACGEPDGAKAQDRRKQRRRKVFAFDKDQRRLDLMRRRVDGAGLSGAIETRLQDFLEVDPADMRFARVTAILLDPSCSGSGIVSAPGRIHDVEGAREGLTGENGREKGEGKGMGTREVGSDESRVDKLAAFQLRGLLKAMSFPQVKRVCYSTCSVHVQENEDVVAKALKQQEAAPTSLSTDRACAAGVAEGDAADSVPPDSRVQGVGDGGDCEVSRAGRFAISRCLPRWSRRGLAVAGLDEEQAACLARADPAEDETNGFFVAVFEREVGGGEPVGATKKRRKRQNKNRKKKKRKREEAIQVEDGDAGDGL